MFYNAISVRIWTIPDPLSAAPPPISGSHSALPSTSTESTVLCCRARLVVSDRVTQFLCTWVALAMMEANLKHGSWGGSRRYYGMRTAPKSLRRNLRKWFGGTMKLWSRKCSVWIGKWKTKDNGKWRESLNSSVSLSGKKRRYITHLYRSFRIQTLTQYSHGNAEASIQKKPSTVMGNNYYSSSRRSSYKQQTRSQSALMGRKRVYGRK
jgi:hypothetical protein